MTKEEFKQAINNYPDFPKKGVVFKEISPILNDPKYLEFAITEMSKQVNFDEIDIIVAPDARGFIFGSILAYNHKKPFVMFRKPGKLPGKKISKNYSLEYGKNVLEIVKGIIKKDQRVLLVDDVLAKGGTAKAIEDIINESQAQLVKSIFLIEIMALKGRDKLQQKNVFSLIED